MSFYYYYYYYYYYYLLFDIKSHKNKKGLHVKCILRKRKRMGNIVRSIYTQKGLKHIKTRNSSQ